MLAGILITAIGMLSLVLLFIIKFKPVLYDEELSKNFTLYWKNMRQLGFDDMKIFNSIREDVTLEELKKYNKLLSKSLKQYNLQKD